jgi:hypothetical protein
MTALKLELTVAEIDMAFLMFQSARQDKYTFTEINSLIRKIQEQCGPQLAAPAQPETPPAPKARAPKAKPAPVVIPQQTEAVVDVTGIPDLSDLNID